MRDSWTFERVAGRFDFTEGPVWSSADGGRLVFTDAPNKRILEYDPSSGDCTEMRTDTGGTNGLATDADGRLYGCESTYRRVVAYDESETIILASTYDGGRLNGPNDLCLDDQGGIWFSDPNYSGDVDIQELSFEAVYYRSGDGNLTQATTDTARPSGVQLSPDGETLYVADGKFRSERVQKLLSYPVVDDGTLGEQRLLHDFGPHRGVDGFCVTETGKIVAAAGWKRSGPGPAIYVFSPSGEILTRHPFPMDRPTNCAFGGDELETLYVTGSGCLFQVETTLAGHVPEHAFDRPEATET